MGHGDRVAASTTESAIVPMAPMDVDSQPSRVGAMSASHSNESLPGSKRGREGSGGYTAGNLSQVDFDSMFSQALVAHQSDMVSAIQGPITSICKEVTKNACKQLESRMGKVEDKLEDVDTKIDSISIQMGKDRHSQDEFQKLLLARMDKLEAGQSTNANSSNGNGVDMGNMSSGINGSSPPTFSEGGFFRTPNPTLLFCNTLDDVKVTRAQFHASFAALALEAGIAPEK